MGIDERNTPPTAQGKAQLREHQFPLNDNGLVEKMKVGQTTLALNPELYKLTRAMWVSNDEILLVICGNDKVRSKLVATARHIVERGHAEDPLSEIRVVQEAMQDNKEPTTVVRIHGDGRVELLSGNGGVLTRQVDSRDTADGGSSLNITQTAGSEADSPVNFESSATQGGGNLGQTRTYFGGGESDWLRLVQGGFLVAHANEITHSQDPREAVMVCTKRAREQGVEVPILAVTGMQ